MACGAVCAGRSGGVVAPASFPDLGTTLVNLGAATVPIGVILWLGWTRSTGLRWRGPDRSWWLLTPLVLEAVSYSLDGVVGTARELASAAVLYIVLSISEEALSRGLVQRVLGVLGPVRAAIGVGLLFGAGHTLSGIWFSRPIDDTAFITLNAAAFGFACAALRWHLRTIWPLVAVHALGDFFQILSPGNLPFGVRVAYLLSFLVYGWWLLQRLPPNSPAATAEDLPPATTRSQRPTADPRKMFTMTITPLNMLPVARP